MPYFTTSDGKQIYYEDTGQGAPLLCLAGLTRNCRDFSYLAPHVTDLRMIAMDYRGRGQSDYDPDYRNYNILREGQDAIELLDHLGLDRAFILGTSRGGLIAMGLAVSHPDRLSGVVLNDVGPVIEPAAIERIMEYVGQKPNAQSYDQAAQALQYLMSAQFPGVPLARWREAAEFQYVETAQGLDLRYDPALRTALIEQSASGEPVDLWPLFDALRPFPTGVIRGANSDLLSSASLTLMQDRDPSLMTAEVPDRGHVPFLDEPEALTLLRRVLEAI